MASDFDSLWNDASGLMHDTYDEFLGDRIRYAIDGVTFVVISATIIDEVVGEGGIEGLDDDIAQRKRVKVRKSIVPEVSLAHRIQHPRLGPGNYRPTNSLPQTEGNYWLFDVQKAS